jgi:formylglycine-generating enzyme required for sulfatase activity
VEGFTALGEETFACPNDVEGRKQFRLRVYRCDAFARAIGLASGKRAPDTEFVLLPPDGQAASATLGSPRSEAERSSDEDQRTVEVVPFLIARTATSQRVYDALGGAHEAYDFPGAMHPVENVDWNEATAFAESHGLRLPSELEWEYACRGGTRTPFCFGSTITTNQVNYDGNHPYPTGKPKGSNRGRTVPVASLPGNAYGLFEVHGNVWEWCEDLYPGSSRRVFRGGSWWLHAVRCRSAYRFRLDPAWRNDYLGFRLSRSYP